MIDGIRSFGSVPQSEIDQLQIITGGIEAKYGDVTGGIISITTRGPSDKITGGFDVETSTPLTPYGYNLAMGYLSGPILKNKKGNTVLGYRVSGQYNSNKDANPSAVGVYRVPENLIREIEENPLYNLGNVRLPSAERLTNDDIGSVLKVRPNEGNRNINLVGKIDAKIGRSVNLSVSGNYVDGVNRFAPSGAWSMLNWVNNPYQYSSRYRLNFNLRHKLGVQALDLVNDKSRKPSVFQNFSYSILGGFERGNARTEDLRHQDKLYNYGYFGSTASTFNPFFGFFVDEVNQFLDFRHLGYTQVNGEFTPGEANSVMAKYNTNNGILNPDLNSVWNNLYSNAGQVYNSFSKSESDLITLNLSAGFDVLPGGSEKGRHSIQFGFLYEQQTLRDWSVAPRGLWRAADLLVNNHIKGIDPDVVVRDTAIFNPLTGSIENLPIYQTLLQIGGQDKFYRTIREKLGVGVNQFVNINGIDPSFLTLDLFSPEELTNESLISYQGYDYLGNKTRGVTFDDFFRARDADGIRTFPVAPFSPIYMSGYIQDKFSYKDIIFRLGLRADYYDANTKVLKDPYSLYEIESAGDFYARTGRQKPASIQNDYKVYVTGPESDEIIGYRRGDEWFTTAGTSITNANLIFNGGVVYPSYVGRAVGGTPASRVLDVQSTEFDVNTSFKDYAPLLNLMPRLAFSFPISEEAGFFAHYDVLYQRPPSNVYMSPLDYYYFNNISSNGPANNPDLRPIRTIDYEVGFQQKISENNSLKVSGYQKEMKDL
ncbi:MAG TPA: TonB-dependent receptor, partial [Saprospiraceae bacterium]|nr:TonB-dependent receptor [Saprospiraceae bacterium]